MNIRLVFWKWAAIGLLAAIFLAWVQARAVGGVAGMLQVGETSALRPMIEGQLGTIPLAPHGGHDGQIFYAIGLDLDGNEVGPLLGNPAYRYRRILSPLLASGFGTVEGWALLWTQVGLGVASFSAATGMVASMSVKAGRSEMIALTVLLNPGLWLSVQILTADMFSVALMVFGLMMVGRSDNRGAGLFAMSTLAKDVSLVTPVPLGMQRRSWRLAVIPVTVLFGWATFLNLHFGDGYTAQGSLALPFMGIVQASRNWPLMPPKEWVYVGIALLSVILGLVFSIKRSWLRGPIAAWTALAIVSSSWVWVFGNNAARAFAPIVVLVGLSTLHDTAVRTSRDEPEAGT